MVGVTSWGRLESRDHEVVRLYDPAAVSHDIQSSKHGIAYGMGRSYGDVCLNPGGTLWNTSAMDRFISFDQQTGLLECEAGVLLRDIQQMAIPRGWILPVTPGSQMVTVGGAIANDVHGKNHHVHGSFGDHVRLIRLERTDGSTTECGPFLNADWFAATIGGFGLTGVVTKATIQLKKTFGPWLDTDSLPYANLSEFFTLADGSEAGWEHTVSWIDCMSPKRVRGIFMRANPSQSISNVIPARRTRTMPFVPPVSLVNKLTLRPFNVTYYHLQKARAGKSRVHYASFFYPLDNLLEWNRMYGPSGFFQYQSVVPRSVGHDATQAMLAEIARFGEGSFLAVLKTFGDRTAPGMMSFTRPGVTLAMDFPNHGKRTEKLFERLDAIVREAHGRIYLAKDARMPRELFEVGYPRLTEFLHYRDPGISSAMSRRLIGS